MDSFVPEWMTDHKHVWQEGPRDGVTLSLQTETLATGEAT